MLRRDKNAGNGFFKLIVKILSFTEKKESTLFKTQAPGAAISLSKSLLKEYSKSEATTLLPTPPSNNS
jgi:hypothetical protein